MRLAELLTEAGLPDGVFNVVHGDREDNEALIRDPRIKAVTLLGSSVAASSVYN